MEDTQQINKQKPQDSRNGEALAPLAGELRALLEEHKAEDALALDLRPFSIWTDFFVIATAQSAAHLDGLKRHVEEWALHHKDSLYLQPKTRQHKSNAAGISDNSSPAPMLWEILDLGGIVAHLMSREARQFYELEKLWKN